MERFKFYPYRNKYGISESSPQEDVYVFQNKELLQQKLRQENLGDYQPLQVVCGMDSFWYVLAEKDNAYYAIYMPWRHNNYYWESEYYTDFIAKYGDLLKGRVMPADKAVEMMRAYEKRRAEVSAYYEAHPEEVPRDDRDGAEARPDKVVENTSTGETTEETESTPVRTAWLWVAAACGAAVITAVIIVLVKSKKRAKL